MSDTAPPSEPQRVDPDEDEETLYCYRHPQRETALRCNNCERPICVDCAVVAAVGMKCRECGRLPRTAHATVPRTKLLRGIAAGVPAGLVLGWLFDYLALGGSFFSFLIAGGVGALV